MPRRAAHPCSHPGCPALVRQGSYCPEHQREKQMADRVVRERYEDRTQRGSATERGYGATWTQTSRRFLAEHSYCQRCGQPATIVHHKIARAQGGRDDEDNLAPLCASCHNIVHGR